MTIAHAIARLRQRLTDHQVTTKHLAKVSEGGVSPMSGWVLMRESELAEIVEALDPVAKERAA